MANQTTQTLTVAAPIERVYSIWADFEQFSRFMSHIVDVTKTGDRTSHWKMQGPFGAALEWDAETTLLEENTRIAWNSRKDSPLTTSGQVIFTDLGNDQTQITLTLQYDPPGGALGEIVASWFVDPEKRLKEDLHNFKIYAENQHTQKPNG